MLLHDGTQLRGGDRKSPQRVQLLHLVLVGDQFLRLFDGWHAGGVAHWQRLLNRLPFRLTIRKTVILLLHTLNRMQIVILVILLFLTLVSSIRIRILSV